VIIASIAPAIAMPPDIRGVHVPVRLAATASTQWMN